MKNKNMLLDGNAAAAWGARLARAQVIPNFPITPQTEIIETLAQWKADGEWNGEFVPLESEHSALSAAIAAAACGARTFTATSSQGLLLMHEMLYVASGMRLPIVMANCSRGLSAPITLWSDHNDILAMRDSGWLIFFAKNNQEVLDSILQAYRIAEDRDVLLPVLVNMEGYILSYTREPLALPQQKLVDNFLPIFQQKVPLDVEKPMSLGVPVMKEYMYFKSQQHAALENASAVIEKTCKEFEKIFGRSCSLIEEYQCIDAETVFVVCGSISTIVQEAVDALRKQNVKIGMLRLRCYRPFPADAIAEALKHCKNIIVIENNVSPGFGGILYPEICSALAQEKNDKKIYDVIVSLGGKPVGRKDFEIMAKKIAGGEEKKFWLL